MKKKSKILITGGAGYFGSVLTEYLLKKGHEVNIIDPMWFGDIGIKHLLKKKLKLYKGNISDKKIFHESIKGVNTVIHLSGLSNDPSCEIDKDITKKINIDETLLLIDKINSTKSINKLLFASSCSVYGFNEKEKLNENSTLNPQSSYAESKIESEIIIKKNKKKELNTVSLRKSTLYGFSRRMRFDLVINIISAKAFYEKKFMINGGKQWRPFLELRDACRIYDYFLENNLDSDFEIFNTGFNSENLSILNLARKVKKIFKGSNFTNSFDPDTRSYMVNFDKIEKFIKKPQFNIQKGILDLKSYYRKGYFKDFKNIKYYNIKKIIEFLNI